MRKSLKEKNQKLFGRRIKQLDHIIQDHNYLSVGNSYRGFILDMQSALLGGRKITPKMEEAITNIVKKYSEYLKKNKDPNFLENKTILLNKINMVRTVLEQAPYTSNFKYEKGLFLDSVYDQASNRGTLSPKQKLALNKMYKQYKKKVENKA